MPMRDTIAEFRKRVIDVWLPTFCYDSKRQYAVEGFRHSSIVVSEDDARDCMYAIDCGLVVDHGGGRYKAARNTAFEQLFWTGLRHQVPRPITLWLEPVITFAALARLHRDHGWPAELLGSQPKTWAFDLVAHAPSNPNVAHILGEVKKTTGEAERLLSQLLSLSFGASAATVPENSRKKWNGLLATKPSVLWIVGPSKHSKVLNVSYPSTDRAVFSEATPSALNSDAI